MNNPFLYRALEAALLTTTTELEHERGGVELAQGLERIGDALRFGVPVPSSLAALFRECSGRELLEAVEVVLETSLRDSPHVGFEPEPQALVLARDRAESVRTALFWLAVVSRVTPDELPASVRLQGALSALDGSLKARTTLQQAEEWLGQRIAFLGEHPWTGMLAEPVEGAKDDGSGPNVLSAGCDLPSTWGPPTHVVATYVRRGVHREWVEGFADHSREFSVELFDTIEANCSLATDVGLVARMWRSRHTETGAGTISDTAVVELPLLRRAAAGADGTGTEQPRWFPLGRLSPLEVEGQLVSRAGAIELQVSAEPDTLAEVRLGDTVTTTGTTDRLWVARHAISGELDGVVVPVAVLTRGGQRFESQVRIVSEQAPQ